MHCECGVWQQARLRDGLHSTHQGDSCEQTSGGAHSASNKHSHGSKLASGRPQHASRGKSRRHDPSDDDNDSSSSSSSGGGPHTDGCSVAGSDCGTSITCTSDVAAAVAAAHRRIRSGPLPGQLGSKHGTGHSRATPAVSAAAAAAAAAELPRAPAGHLAAAKNPARSKGLKASSSSPSKGGVQRGCGSSPLRATNLAAMADATLKKLQRLSAEGLLQHP
jgi:hypothetical protein